MATSWIINVQHEPQQMDARVIRSCLPQLLRMLTAASPHLNRCSSALICKPAGPPRPPASPQRPYPSMSGCLPRQRRTCQCPAAQACTMHLARWRTDCTGCPRSKAATTSQLSQNLATACASRLQSCPLRRQILTTHKSCLACRTNTTELPDQEPDLADFVKEFADEALLLHELHICQGVGR